MFWNSSLTIVLAVTSFRAAAGRCSLLAENLCFLQFQNLTTDFFAAVLSILPLCQSSVSLVSTQITEPCYESIKAKVTFIYTAVCCWGVGLGQVFPNFPGHVPLQHFVIWTCIPKISYDRKTVENNKNIFANIDLMILKIFTDVDLCTNMSISKWIVYKHNFSLLLLTLNIHFQIGKSIPRDTCPCTLVCEPLD